MRTTVLSAWALVAGTVVTCALVSSPADAGERRHIAAIEREMLPAVSLAGASTKPESLQQEMGRLHVPGISVAVIRNGRIVWSKGYGWTKAGGSPITRETLFQAASISKPVTAVAALRLVEAGKLSLDADVNTQLTSWRLKETKGGPVTLRQLLAHTAGITAHGFSGYASGKPVPTLHQVLNGAVPANSEAVVSETAPGSAVSYSGGGYEVVQQLVEDRTGEDFATLMRKTVLEPAGMMHSRFDQPLARALVSQAAQPHDASGTAVAGGPYTYPELAAAGMWTTAEDLARFMIAVQSSASGAPGALLSRDMATAMLTPGLGGRGLGFEMQGDNATRSFSHGGANEGYRNYLFAYYPNGDGAVVMTNATQGDKVGRDLVRSIAREYGWPTNRTVVRTAIVPDPALSARLVGNYDIPGFGTFSILRDGDGIAISLRPGVVEHLYPSAADEFFLLSQDTRLKLSTVNGQVAGHLIGATFDLPFRRAS